MNSNLKTITAVLALALVGYAAYAENVTISTFYPSPYGSYQSLETTGNTRLATAGDVVLVGTTVNPPGGVKMTVQGGAINTSDTVGGPSAYMQGGAAAAIFGALDARPVHIGNTEGTSTLVLDGGNVSIPGRITGALRLEDSDTPAQTGALQVDCSTGPCYALAVYS